MPFVPHLCTYLVLTSFLLWQGCSGCNEKPEKDLYVTVGELAIHNPLARSCDVLVQISETAPELQVVFPESVNGRFDRRAEKMTISLIHRSDERFRETVVRIRAVRNRDNGDPQPSILEIGEVRCFDGNGELIDNPEVTL